MPRAFCPSSVTRPPPSSTMRLTGTPPSHGCAQLWVLHVCSVEATGIVTGSGPQLKVM